MKLKKNRIYARYVKEFDKLEYLLVDKDYGNGCYVLRNSDAKPKIYNLDGRALYEDNRYLGEPLIFSGDSMLTLILEGNIFDGDRISIKKIYNAIKNYQEGQSELDKAYYNTPIWFKIFYYIPYKYQTIRSRRKMKEYLEIMKVVSV